MLDNILGFPIVGWYLLGIIFVLLAVMLVIRAGKLCWSELKTVVKGGWKSRTGKCVKSLRDLGIFGVALILYLMFLLVVSIYVIVYGWQFGWTQVYTLDLAFAIGYIVLLAMAVFGRKL